MRTIRLIEVQVEGVTKHSLPIDFEILTTVDSPHSEVVFVVEADFLKDPTYNEEFCFCCVRQGDSIPTGAHYVGHNHGWYVYQLPRQLGQG